MVPIHDSDVAQERFAQEEWRNFELWEKIEVRLRRRKRWYLAGAVAIFLAVASIPVLMEQWGRLKGLTYAARLADEVRVMRFQAATEHTAFRLKFTATQNDLGRELEYVVERVKKCSDPMGTLVKEGRLGGVVSGENSVVRLTAEQGRLRGLQNVIDEFCFDPYEAHGTGPWAFVFSPRSDLFTLTEASATQDLVGTYRQDRLAFLMLRGVSAEISFD